MLPNYSAGYGLDQSGNPVVTNQGLNQGLLGLGQQGGGNPLYPMDNSTPSYQAQDSGTAQAQSATQPTMNTGNTGQYDQFLTNAYQSQLGRTPDQAGYQYWQNALNSGQVTPQDLIKQFQGSNEYKANQALRSANATQNPWGLTDANATGLQTSTNPYIQAAQQTALGNYQGAQTATAANRVNQNTPYASLQYQQTGTDANGNPIWSANQTLNPQLQTALSGLQSQLAAKAGQGINTNALAQTGINPGELYSDAIMRRLQPQLKQQAASVENQLANQGIMPGSEAYNRAKTQLAQAQNDALTSAQVQGMDVGLRANQQGYNQALSQANLPFTQLGAFQQATQPGYVNPYNQAAVSGPDYTGAYTTSQAAQIAANNAAAARNANLQSGLFGIGSAALLGGGGIGGLTSLGKGAYDWLTGGNATTPSWLTNPAFSDYTSGYGAGTAYNAMTPDEILNMQQYGI